MSLITELLSKLNITDENIRDELNSYAESNSELIALISLEFKRTLLGDRLIYAHDNYRTDMLERILSKNGIAQEEIRDIIAYEDDVKCNPKHYCITIGVLMKELYNEIASKCPLFMKAIGNSFGTSLALVCIVSKTYFSDILTTSADVSTQLLKHIRDVISSKNNTGIHRNYTFHAFMYYICTLLSFRRINFPEAIRLLAVINRITDNGETISVRFISELLLRGLKSESFFNKLNDKSVSGTLIQVIMLCTIIDMVETNYEPDKEYDNLRNLSLTHEDVRIVCTPVKKHLYVIERKIKPDIYRIHRVRSNDVYDMIRLKDQFVEKIRYNVNDVKSYLDKKDLSANELLERRSEQEELIRNIQHEMYRERTNVFSRCFFMSVIILIVAVIIYVIMNRDINQIVQTSNESEIIYEDVYV